MTTPRSKQTRFSTMLGIGLLVGLVLAGAAGAGAADPQQGPRRERRGRAGTPGLDIVTLEATCTWAAQPPKLDGKLDDPCWRGGRPIEKFASFWKSTPREGTRAYLAWDDKYLYYAGTMTDSELRAFGTRRNDSLWDGDVFELFLKPRADRPPYYELQANPKELVFECFFPKRGDFPKDFHNAPRLGNEAKVVVDGTLDTPGDTDKGWSVEGRVPWKAFEPTGGRPQPGDVWNFAICRYDYGPKGTEPVTMSSAPLTQLNFHRHEDYAKLRFEGPRSRARSADR